MGDDGDDGKWNELVEDHEDVADPAAGDLIGGEANDVADGFDRKATLVSSSSSTESSSVPEMDNVAYGIVMLLGAGFLFPWMCFITAVDYFQMVYPQRRMEFYIAIFYEMSGLVGHLLVVIFGSRFSFAARIVPGYLLLAGCLAITPFLELIFPLDTAFSFTLLVVIVLGVADAVAQNTLYGYTAIFPPVYVQGLMNGNGLAGITVSICRIITKVSVPATEQGERISTRIFFLSFAVVMIVCVATFFMLQKRKITIYYLNSIVSSSKTRDVELKTMNINEGESDDSDHHSSSSVSLSPSEAEWRKAGAASLKSAFLAVWKSGLLLLSIFLITLSIIPGLASEIPSHTPLPDRWFPVITLTLFNLFDWIGRSLPRWAWAQRVSERTLYLMNGCRLVFIPLFVLCVYPPLFKHDSIPIVLCILLGLTNGYLASMTMMFAPSKSEEKSRELAGNIMALFLVSGLTSGSLIGLLLKFLLFPSSESLTTSSASMDSSTTSMT
eukprot:TRINITY_DN9853_c0_g1_i1.p1 TRINITY_DN9853_c0_g1~~TRINITY_DN9853_c0_g1_i1.p1  ORF type:complete len:505 (+),score=92.51 TRINITY_DN9853_c0_g1_i1:27-1517(+)